MVASLFLARGWTCSTHGRELRKECFAQLTAQETAQAVAAACAAVLMSCTTSSGWETIATWLDGTSTVVAPIRLAKTLGIGRERLVIRGDQVPGWQRFPGRNTYHVLEGGRGQRLLHRVHDPGLHRVHVSREVVHEVVLWQPAEALLVDAEVRQC